VEMEQDFTLLPYKIVNRREEDMAKCFSDVHYAKELLG